MSLVSTTLREGSNKRSIRLVCLCFRGGPAELEMCQPTTVGFEGKGGPTPRRVVSWLVRSYLYSVGGSLPQHWFGSSHKCVSFVSFSR